ncbi:DUF6901 family protein [Cerasicoccus arenae]|uniref:Uncharacterized protein n=1 Tax=Cerasicoccus arenae TaxID=424488 RepID=A0A8J3GEA3_9BACT|nr:hypothetical protein [Cerasicoccus arenae]MBK1859909.1 hypothetical protein [Cerasicoccus arenae]GHC12744.1 hypothetical protein GCM10007047_32690 [Cerasicoccus arenae]
MSSELPHYQIRLDDGRIIELSSPARIMPVEWASIPNLPEWTRLSYHQCSNCPLDEKRIERCPAAASVADLVQNFTEVISFEKVDLVITWTKQKYTVRDSAQMIVFALLVEFVSRAKCPYLFDPSADKGFFILCLDIDQLLYRFFSSFLIQHHFLSSGEPDPHAVNWHHFQEYMGGIRIALEGLLARMQAYCREDANINALTGFISVSKLLEEHWDESLRLFKDKTFG